jgi:site-specific DNA recombinase
LTLCGTGDGTNAKARRSSAGFRQVTMVAGTGFEPVTFRL